jgi:LysR family transcriptional regulator, nitrogen assimilation regulatory protein
MMLTYAGKQLHEGLQSIERRLRSLKDDVAAASVEPSGEVAFGIPPSPRGLIAVPLIKTFNKAYPRVVVRIIEETSAQLRDLVANGIIDVAVTNTHEPGHGVTAQALGRERMLLVGAASAKLSMRKETPIQALEGLPLVLTTRPNSLRLTIETGLAEHGLQPTVRFEVNTLPLMTDLVTAGLGYPLPLASRMKPYLLLNDRFWREADIRETPTSVKCTKPEVTGARKFSWDGSRMAPKGTFAERAGRKRKP